SHGSHGSHGFKKDQGYRVIDFDQDNPDAGLLRSTLTIQEGADDLNRFRAVRIQAAGGDCHDDPTVMLLSPFGFPAEFWQIEDGGPSSGFAQQLALAGYDVWRVVNSLTVAVYGERGCGAVVCSPMVECVVQTAVDDALFVR